MHSLAKILEISPDNKTMTVLSLTSSACINCPSIKNCPKNSKRLQITNSINAKAAPGDYVKITLPSLPKTITGLLSLFLPVLMAVAGYFFCPQIKEFENHFILKHLSFLVSLACLLAGEAAVLIYSKSNAIPARPQLIQIL